MQWCILRTAPSRTLLLAAALTAAGYRAWTPQERRLIRVGPQRKQKEIVSAMTPTIVFAEYDRLPILIAASRALSPSLASWCDMESREVSFPLPNFTPFKHNDGYPRISDRALDPLRLAEQRGRAKAQAPVFKVNDSVRFADAGFEGLVGTVVGARGRYAVVSFTGLDIPVHIAPHNLMAA